VKRLRIADFGLRIGDIGDWRPVNPDEFKKRTKLFGLRVIRLVDSLPRSRTADVLGRQLLRCGTSVGANYRAACRSRSSAEFVSKMGIVEEECDESIYWMELITEAGLMDEHRLDGLKDEAGQLIAMVVSSIRTARSRKSTRNPK
jgi:four helix bundle protein